MTDSGNWTSYSITGGNSSLISSITPVLSPYVVEPSLPLLTHSTPVIIPDSENRNENSNLIVPILNSTRVEKSNKCIKCKTISVHPFREYKICADCVVKILKEANIIVRRESYLGHAIYRGRKMCEYCMEYVISSQRQTSICMDCMTLALKIHKILRYESRKEVRVKKIHPPDTDNGFFMDKRESPRLTNYRKKMCDVCKKDIIHSKRSQKVCVDCLVSALIKKGIIEIKEEDEYQI